MIEVEPRIDPATGIKCDAHPSFEIRLGFLLDRLSAELADLDALAGQIRIPDNASDRMRAPPQILPLQAGLPIKQALCFWSSESGHVGGGEIGVGSSAGTIRFLIFGSQKTAERHSAPNGGAQP